MIFNTAEHVDVAVAVVGGGQAGLAIGYYLRQQSQEFKIIDAGARVGDAWRSRWDSLRLFTPARWSSLPGMPFPAPRGYYPTKDEMAEYLERYAVHFGLPVRLNSTVTRLGRLDGRYTLTVGQRPIVADRVVVSIGPSQRPVVPSFAVKLDPATAQLHSAAYRNPSQLPTGDILLSALATRARRSPSNSPRSAAT